MGLLSLFLRLRDIEHAWVTLAAFMHKFVEAKKRDLAQHGDNSEQQRGDIFSRLVAASDGAGKYGLEEQEVVRRFPLLNFPYLTSTYHVDRQYFYAHVCRAW